MSDYGLPKYCPIDGSDLYIEDIEEDGILVCSAHSHNWLLEFSEDRKEFYSLQLQSY